MLPITPRGKKWECSILSISLQKYNLFLYRQLLYDQTIRRVYFSQHPVLAKTPPVVIVKILVPVELQVTGVAVQAYPVSSKKVQLKPYP